MLMPLLFEQKIDILAKNNSIAEISVLVKYISCIVYCSSACLNMSLVHEQLFKLKVSNYMFIISYYYYISKFLLVDYLAESLI